MFRDHKKNKNYRYDVDGLRAIAVLLVFIFHLMPESLPGGFIGVDVFFVISGYLITGILIRDIKFDEFSYLKFYARRVRRIFPALFFMLLGSLIIAFLSLDSVSFLDFIKSFKMAAAQISNFHFAADTGYFQESHNQSALLHTWSLGVEEQYYLVWPFLLMALYKYVPQKDRLKILGGVIVLNFLLSEWLAQKNPQLGFYMFYSRFWELSFGSFLAISQWRIKNTHLLILAKWFSLCALIFFSFQLTGNHSFPGINALGVCVACFILLIPHKTIGKTLFDTNHWLGGNTIVFIGKISYSLYLWHWPMIIFFRKQSPEGFSNLHYTLITGVSFFFAYISWAYIENPFRLPKLSIKQKKITLASGALLILLTVIFGNLIRPISKSPLRFTHNIQRDSFRMTPYYTQCVHKEEEFKNASDIKIKTDCIFGSNKRNYEALLIGDSHAAHYIPVVKHWADKKNISLRVLTTNNCPPLFGDFTLVQYDRLEPRCNTFANHIIKSMRSNRNLKYVFIGLRLDLYSETFELSDPSIRVFLVNSKNNDWSVENSRSTLKANLAKTLNVLNRMKYKVMLLKQPPILPMDPLKCVETRSTFLGKLKGLSPKDCLKFDWVFNSKRQEASNKIIEDLLGKYNFEVFNPQFYLKSSVNKKGQSLYYDGDHLSAKGGEFLKTYLQPSW